MEQAMVEMEKPGEGPETAAIALDVGAAGA